MSTEYKFFIAFMTVAMLFFGAGMHTSNYEAEQILKSYGIDAELEFEKGDEPNFLEQMEMDREKFLIETYHIDLD
jgi:hypothetical protein